MTVQFEKYAVTNSAWAEFLNACASKEDRYRLWTPLMSEHYFGGILRESVGSDCFYRVKTGYEKKPVTYVSWESAARYCNWVSYGKPYTGRSELGTTEGDDRYGVYDTRRFGSPEFVRGYDPVKRNTDSAYFLPRADEWRLAAFAGGDDGDPIVYQGHWARPFPHLADVDEGVTNSLGLVNMLGNVAEWVEDRRPNGNFFMALGGSVIRGTYSLMPNYIEGDESDKPIGTFGIRLAHACGPSVLPRPAAKELMVYESARSLSVESGDVPWCRIGFPGNRRDPLYKVGRVDYEYEMARYAVTNAEWCDFMNDVGYERSCALGLYNPDMSTGACGGIRISTDSRFEPKSGCARRPVVYVGYKDAMRYCNWLQTGDTEHGAYDLKRITYHRLPGARYFIPTDDEWCKAAYFDPTRLGARKYWDYPCRTSDLPSNDPLMPHACNYLKDDRLGEKAPYYLAEVDAYPTSDTYFGCRQMAGNVWEWVEPADAGVLNLRGTSFGYTEFGMGIWNRDRAGYDDELNVFGLRIARLIEGTSTVKPTMVERISDWLADVSLKRLLVGVVICSICVLAIGVGLGKGL